MPQNEPRKHTPGPWDISNTRGTYRPLFEIGSPTHSFWIAAVGTGAEKLEVAEANAHLIAAAPKLLEACKKLEFNLRHESLNKELSADTVDWMLNGLDMLTDVIAKAEGAA